MAGVLNTKSRPSEEALQKISPFVFCRWLSGSIHAVQAANMLNLHYNIPVECQYNIIKNAFGGKIKYIPYPKSITDKTSYEQSVIAKHFKINENMAREYLELIDRNELKEIVGMYES